MKSPYVYGVGLYIRCTPDSQPVTFTSKNAADRFAVKLREMFDGQKPEIRVALIKRNGKRCKEGIAYVTFTAPGD